MTEYQKKYQKTHPEVYARAQKKWHAAHPEVQRRYKDIRKAWDEKNKTYLAEHARLNYQLKKADCDLTRMIIMSQKTYLKELRSKKLI